jgi:hypothetical protein
VSDTNELIDRLRNAAWGRLVDFPICDEAADTIARLEAERDAARREAMEKCARMADEYATWGGSNFAAWFEKLAAAIRAAMP